MGQSSSTARSAMAEKFVKDKIDNNKVVVFSKSYCPFCSMAKKSLTDVGLKNFTIIEIEDRDDCKDIQDVLGSITGARSVPRVFIGGKFIGGGSEVQEMQRNGRLVKMLKEVEAL